jgi:hypothetical protein
MDPTTLTIIAIICPILTGIGGVFLGHYLASKRIDIEIQKLIKKDIQTEKRHKEEKFENAIQYWGILGNFSVTSKDKNDKKEWSIYEKFYLMECKERKDLYQWLKTNQIMEVSDFIYWLDKKIPQWQVTRFLEPIKR